jgi:intracellular sulfur oxidation DsrE/DsrF family protein
MVFDTTTPEGLSSALLFANNYYLANASGYGLQDADLAVVIVARHWSTPFAFNESIWSKYGAQISNHIGRSKEPAKTNAYARQVEGLIRRGAHFAVCQMASRAIAGSISRETGASMDEIYNEIAGSLVSNSHLAPAGIVAVGRAQDRGYSVVVGV